MTLNFGEIIAFVILVYMLRHVKDEFKISLELKIVAISWCLVALFTYIVVVFLKDPELNYFWITYFLMLARNVICLVVSAIIPLYQTTTNSLFIPFPVNKDCISSIEMVLHIPLSANYFYDYIESSECSDRSAVHTFALYTDIRYYDRAC